MFDQYLSFNVVVRDEGDCRKVHHLLWLHLLEDLPDLGQVDEIGCMRCRDPIDRSIYRSVNKAVHFMAALRQQLREISAGKASYAC